MKALEIIQSNFAGEEDSLSVVGGRPPIKNLRNDNKMKNGQTFNQNKT